MRINTASLGPAPPYALDPKSWIGERLETLKQLNSQSIPKPLKPIVKGTLDTSGAKEDDGLVVASL